MTPLRRVLNLPVTGFIVVPVKVTALTVEPSINTVILVPLIVPETVALF